MGAMNPFLNQHHTRIRSDNNSADGGTPTWQTTENQSTALSWNTATAIRIRFGVENTGTATANQVRRMFVSRNGGSYTEVNATSSVCRTIDASSGADAYSIATSNFLLTAGTGTALTGDYRDNANPSITANLAAGEYTEYEFGFEIIDADVNNGDTLDFRVYYNGAAMDNYAHTPRISVNKVTAYTLPVDLGSYAQTGQTADLQRDLAVPLTLGSYALTGQDPGLFRDKAVIVDLGSYSLNGQDATLVRALAMVADLGSYSLAGQDPTLAWARILDVTLGSYAYTGQDPGLFKSKTLIVDLGSYTYTGLDPALQVDWAVTVDAGAYTLAGGDPELQRDLVEALTLGSYAITGRDPTLLRGYFTALTLGGYSLVGQDPELLRALVADPDAGSYLLAGQDPELLRALMADLQAGVYTSTGLDPTLNYTPSGAYTLPQDAAGSYGLTGLAPTLVPDLLAEEEGFNPTGIGAVVGMRERDRDAEEARQRWLKNEADRRRAVEAAFEKVFETGDPPPSPAEVSKNKRRQVAREARRMLDTSGIMTRLIDLQIMVDQYLAYIEARKKRQRNDEALVLLLS